MAWRRYDDNYEDHPKILSLIELVGYEGYYRLGRLHAYSARNKTNGILIPLAIREQNVSKKILDALLLCRLLDRDDDGTLRIHDWADFQAKDDTAAERMRRYRDRRVTAALRNESRNEFVTRATRVPEPEPVKDITLAVSEGAKDARDNDAPPGDDDDGWNAYSSDDGWRDSDEQQGFNFSPPNLRDMP